MANSLGATSRELRLVQLSWRRSSRARAKQVGLATALARLEYSNSSSSQAAPIRSESV